MKTNRPSPIPLNKPHRVFGFDPQGLMGCCIALSFGVLYMIRDAHIGMAIIAASLLALGGVYLYGNHKILIVTTWRALWQKARYEPSRRDVFRLEIK